MTYTFRCLTCDVRWRGEEGSICWFKPEHGAGRTFYMPPDGGGMARHIPVEAEATNVMA